MQPSQDGREMIGRSNRRNVWNKEMKTETSEQDGMREQEKDAPHHVTQRRGQLTSCYEKDWAGK
jgi:hypothetical protein